MEALLDTGSTVSTVSKMCYTQHLSHLEVKSLDSILKIECADGQDLPYEGYIEATLTLEGTGLRTASNSIISGIFLVVPDGPYNSSVPVLIGTNLMTVLMDRVQQEYGRTFLQSAKLVTPLYLAFRCMVLRERELEKHGYRLAIVRCAAEKPVIIRPNSEVLIDGYAGKKLSYPAVCALVQPTPGSRIPTDIDITPTLLPYHHEMSGIVKIHVTNPTTSTVTIQPRALMCELQSITVEEITKEPTPEPPPDVLEKVEFLYRRFNIRGYCQGKTTTGETSFHLFRQ